MSMSDRDGFIWHDGKLVPWRDATTHVLTHTLHYGMGVFEGVRAYKATEGTAIFRLREHTERLFNSAHIFQMKMPWDKETIMEAHRETRDWKLRCRRIILEGDRQLSARFRRPQGQGTPRTAVDRPGCGGRGKTAACLKKP